MPAKNPQKATAHAQYQLPPQVFDAFDKAFPIQHALGSVRNKAVQEITELKSTNYSGSSTPTVAYRLTNRGIDLQGLATFLAGSIVADEVLTGSGTSFTFAFTPISILSLSGNGLRLTNTVDFSFSGTTLTILVGTFSAGTIVASYLK